MNVKRSLGLATIAVVLSACSQAAATPVLPTLAPLRVPSTSPTAPVPVTAVPTAAPTAAPTAVPTVAPTPQPTAAPTLEPTAEPTAEPSVEPTASAAEEPFPNAVEDLLISHVLKSLQGTCERTDQIYKRELDSITCGDEIAIDYTLFETLDDLKEAYDADVKDAETKPIKNGKCNEGTFEATYTIDKVVAGRLQCREHTNKTTLLKYHVMEWTNEELLTIAYISNRVKTWDEVIAFWTDDAGPFKS